MQAPFLAHLSLTGKSTLGEADPANSPGVLSAKMPPLAKENKPKADRGPLTLVSSLANAFATNVLTGAVNRRKGTSLQACDITEG